MDRWLINGIDGDSISVNDRGLLYGDGLFETIAVRHGQPRFVEYHFARLKSGCMRLAIEPPDMVELSSDIAELLQGHDHAAIKIVVTRGTGTRGYSPASATKPQRIVGITATAPSPAAFYTEGVNVHCCRTTISRNPALAGIKSLNRLEQVLARSEWGESSIAEGLMFDEMGNLVCGTMSNVFVVLENTLLTPDLSFSGVHGVMRQQLLECCDNAGISIEQAPIGGAMLEEVSEVFLTNSLIGLWPVRMIGGRRLTSREYASPLMELLAASGVSECEVLAGE